MAGQGHPGHPLLLSPGHHVRTTRRLENLGFVTLLRLNSRTAQLRRLRLRGRWSLQSRAAVPLTPHPPRPPRSAASSCVCPRGSPSWDGSWTLRCGPAPSGGFPERASQVPRARVWVDFVPPEAGSVRRVDGGCGTTHLRCRRDPCPPLGRGEPTRTGTRASMWLRVPVPGCCPCGVPVEEGCDRPCGEWPG